MRKKVVTVEAKQLDIRGAKNMIFSNIDNQINNHKIQFLVDWERNHSTSSSKKDHNIKILELAKKDLTVFLNQFKDSDIHVDFTFNLEVKVIPKTGAKTLNRTFVNQEV